MSKRFKAAVIGGSGYGGGELVRRLLLHPDVEDDISFAVLERAGNRRQVTLGLDPDQVTGARLAEVDHVTPVCRRADCRSQ